MNKSDIIITGVGGQGVILASDIIGEAALAVGYDVKKTDTLGMAQRGGSVLSHVRIGPQVSSPLIKEGTADILLAFEKLEAARCSHYLRPGAIAIVNNYARPPLSVNLGIEQYPSDGEILAILKRRTDRIYFFEGINWAERLGNMRMLNIFMLGCASVFLPLKVGTWQACINQHISVSVQQSNIAAFKQGRKEIRNVSL